MQQTCSIDPWPRPSALQWCEQHSCSEYDPQQSVRVSPHKLVNGLALVLAFGNVKFTYDSLTFDEMSSSKLQIQWLMVPSAALNVKKHTLIDCWMKSTVISIPNSSSAILVNLLMILEALKTARRISILAAHIQTLQEINIINTRTNWKLFGLENSFHVRLQYTIRSKPETVSIRALPSLWRNGTCRSTLSPWAQQLLVST